MAPADDSVSDWLIFKINSALKLLNQMNRNLLGRIYRQSPIQVSHFVLIH
jgi:hypothetical protein